MTTYVENTWTAYVGNAIVARVSHLLAGGLKRVAHNPLNALGICMLGIGTLAGGVNALWLQPAHHPSPLFMETASITEPGISVPAPQIQRLPAIAVPAPGETSPVVSRIPAPRPSAPVYRPIESSTDQKIRTVGNKEVATLQAKLSEMALFTGKVDGYYGPETATAIRAFERNQGVTPKGAITPQILSAVARARVPQRNAISVSAPHRPIPIAPPNRNGSAVLQPISDQPSEPRPSGIVIDNIAKIALSATPNDTPIAKPAVVSSVDPELVKKAQTGLVRLGFLNAPINGKFDAQTARAIREFENYNNYERTGAMSLELVDMLRSANAFD